MASSVFWGLVAVLTLANLAWPNLYLTQVICNLKIGDAQIFVWDKRFRPILDLSFEWNGKRLKI